MPGFRIGGNGFEFPEKFRMCDPVLVKELTGLDFAEFGERLDDNDGAPDPLVLVGMIGVGVWQKHPNWSRDRVRRYVELIDMTDFETVDDQDEAVVRPPAPSSPSLASSSEFTTTPEDFEAAPA